jgi:nucleotide-binding universal stress UspA family protein
MAIREVLLPVHDDVGQQARFECAVAVARTTGASIRCLSIVTELVPAGDDWGMSALVMEAQRADAVVNRHAMEVQLLQRGVPHRWDEAAGDFTQIIGREAPASDLVILDGAPGAADGRGLDHVAGAALTHGARAVLALPDAHSAFFADDTAVIAWDASPAAKAAVHAALPFLLLASQIVVVIVSRQGCVPTEELTTLLVSARRNLSITWRDPKGDVARTLLETAASYQPSYVVMGGYGHARLREAIFGGVTRALLRESPFPLLLAHPKN